METQILIVIHLTVKKIVKGSVVHSDVRQEPLAAILLHKSIVFHSNSSKVTEQVQ